MVVFVCSACGQAIKKNQVEKHYMQQCRNCESLACLDCNKEFWGDEYKTHTQCISEDQKYGGKDFKPKPNSNKGDLKQEMWIENLKNSLVSANISPQISSYVKQLLEYPNIPRKESKFSNFARNSLKLNNSNLISEIWNLFNSAHQNATKTSENDKLPISKSFNDSCNVDVTEVKEGGNFNGCKRKRDGFVEKETKSSELTTDSHNDKKLKSDSEAAEIEDVSDGKRIKFKWTKNIKALLREKPDKTMSLKKLRKKLLKIYQETMKDCEEQTVIDILQTRLEKCSKIEVAENQIKLIE